MHRLPNIKLITNGGFHPLYAYVVCAHVQMKRYETSCYLFGDFWEESLSNIKVVGDSKGIKSSLSPSL